MRFLFAVEEHPHFTDPPNRAVTEASHRLRPLRTGPARFVQGGVEMPAEGRSAPGMSGLRRSLSTKPAPMNPDPETACQPKDTFSRLSVSAM
jgi:hypothetical protein